MMKPTVKPTVPKPSSGYIASKREESKTASLGGGGGSKAKEEMREQAPFWMSQATLAYSVPNKYNEISLATGIFLGSNGASDTQEYNGVSFTEGLKRMNIMNGGGRGAPAGTYKAMGSFWNTDKNAAPANPKNPQLNLMGRYFLVEVTDPNGYTLPNPDIMGAATLFAPADSFILAFSGSQNASVNEYVFQDSDWTPTAFWPSGIESVGPKYETYDWMLKAHEKMFHGVQKILDADGTPTNNYMMGVTQALKSAGFAPRPPAPGPHAKPGSPIIGGDKMITIVGHSLGGAQAQLAAVAIATKFLAKVRVITFDSILAFTPESAARIAGEAGGEGLIVGPDGALAINAEPTVQFPVDAGKITAQRWVEDDSIASAAPLFFPAGLACGPLAFLNPLNWPCCPLTPACSCPCNPLANCKYKYKLVGCWPFNRNLGKGYLSRALVISGYQAGVSVSCGPPSTSINVPGGPPSTSIGPFGCYNRKQAPYENTSFVLDISDDRTYKTKAVRRLSCFGNFFCESATVAINHNQSFILWMLYKGAFQNEDAPTSGNQKVSQYVPKVYAPASAY